MGIRIADALAMRRDPGKLRFFSIADSLALKVYRITDLLPTEERYGLQSQLRRAAVSVVTNIIEGSCRRTDKAFSRRWCRRSPKT
jgi:hypothetical protein